MKIMVLLIVLLLFFGCFSEKPQLSKIQLEEPELDSDCSFDKFNCSDFTTQQQAQAMLEKCGKDVHRLDRDKDGKACEE